jgi:hypothetical protein
MNVCYVTLLSIIYKIKTYFVDKIWLKLFTKFLGPVKHILGSEPETSHLRSSLFLLLHHA